MAKKVKKVIIKDEPLVATTLAIKEDKKKASVFGIIWIILIFGIFIAGVIYLPDLSSYVNNLLNPDITNTGTASNNNKDNTKDDDKKNTEEIKKLEIASNPEFVMDTFKINNIKIENNKLSIDIVNTTSKLLDMSTLNYFIVLYDANNKLLQRIMIDEATIGENGTLNVKYNLSETSASIISVLPIKEEEYPSFTATVDENNSGKLICKSGYETVTYLLNTNKVYAIQDIYEVSSNEAEFSTLYSTYQALSTTYNVIEGISSSVDLENNVLYFRTIINLNTYKEGNLKLKTIYNKDTDAKVMKFELEASGYTCS